MRRSLLLLLLLLLAIAVTLRIDSASAQGSEVARPIVHVVKVQGVIDPALTGFLREVLAEAAGDPPTVILQMDSRWGYGRNAGSLVDVIRRTSVPVVAWIAPSGSRVEGPAQSVFFSASVTAMAPGAGLGNRAAGDALRGRAVDLIASDIRDLLVKLDGRRVETGRGAVTLVTLNRGGRQVEVRFHDMGPIRRILHAVSTPTAVYVLLVFALWGIAFEVTQPGIGVAGFSAALALALAVYALSIVPVNWVGLGLILAGTGLQWLDVLIRRVGLLTVAGTVLFAGGSVLAWSAAPDAIDLAPWLIVVATLGGALFFGFALTVALRARERVRSSQVGLVGLVGEARGDLDPEGAVFVKGTMWRAKSMNGPIPKGARIRVRGIDGLILRVEEEPE
ncbi:MAG TPA: NfeD family protein [Actinomycetota bacterium]|nr:NfeD family protein [Actinomycetota bacterium]